MPVVLIEVPPNIQPEAMQTLMPKITRRSTTQFSNPKILEAAQKVNG